MIAVGAFLKRHFARRWQGRSIASDEPSDTEEPEIIWQGWAGGDAVASWTRQLPTMRTQFDWAREGAVWLSHLANAIAREASGDPDAYSGSWTASTEGGTRANPGVLFCERSFDMTCLWIRFNGGRLTMEVRGAHGADLRAVAVWRRAVERATAELRATPLVPWVAAISCVGATAQRLDVDTIVGTLDLRTTTTAFGRYLAEPLSFNGARLSTEFPVTVRGASRGSVRQDPEGPSRDLRRLCAVMSLGFANLWTLVHPATEGEALDIPEHLYWQKRPHVDREPWSEVVSIEPWMINAATADLPLELEHALFSHYEGLQLDDEGHPSVALLCFIAAIETLAAMDVDLPECSECHQVRGSTARFRGALAQVVDDESAKKLAKAYERRSKTVHAAQLHSTENAFGAFVHDFHRAGSTGEFRSLVWQVRDAGRDLLINRIRSVD